MFDDEKVSVFIFVVVEYRRKFINNKNFPIYGSAEFFRNNFCSFRSFALNCEN